jgi:hypothetical protein
VPAQTVQGYSVICISNLICSGQMTRAEAVEELKTNTYTEELMKSDREYVIKKLELTDAEFDEIMALPIRTHADYPNYEKRTPGDRAMNLALRAPRFAIRTIRRLKEQRLSGKPVSSGVSATLREDI